MGHAGEHRPGQKRHYSVAEPLEDECDQTVVLEAVARVAAVGHPGQCLSRVDAVRRLPVIMESMIDRLSYGSVSRWRRCSSINVSWVGAGRKRNPSLAS